MSKRESHLYIEDIKDFIDRIEEYTKNISFDDFCKDRKTIDAVVRNLSVIGEAVQNLPEETKLKYSDIPWNEIAGMRNKIIHEYFGVDEEILWKTIKEDLPAFKTQVDLIDIGTHEIYK